jgi:hypothetical protein
MSVNMSLNETRRGKVQIQGQKQRVKSAGERALRTVAGAGALAMVTGLLVSMPVLATTSTISGVVTIAGTSTPIAGVTVATSPASTTATTDSTGSYSLSVTSGTYDVLFTMSGYNNNFVGAVNATSNAAASQALVPIPAQAAQDLFSRPDQNGIGTASDGHTWTRDSGVYPLGTVDIVNRQAFVQTASAATSLDAWMGIAYRDQEVTADINMAVAPGGGQHGGRLLARVVGSDQWLVLALNPTDSTLTISVAPGGGGAWALLGTAVHGFALQTWYHAKLRVVGPDAFGKAWALGSAEPADWQVRGLQSSVLNSGVAGIRMGGADAYFANFLETPITEISGEVMDAGTSAFIPGATVTLNTGPTTTSDANGDYVFNNVAPGSYTVTASAANHNSSSLPVTVTAIGVGGLGADFSLTPTVNVYTAVTPVRLLDTRNTGPTLGNGGSLDLAIGGIGNVPANATAVVLNVTAVNETTAGAFTVYPTGTARPLASNLNWVAWETVPNLVTVGLGTNGNVTIFNGAGRADAVVDLEGYFAPTGGGTAGQYVPVVPSRITDTRPGSGQANAGATLTPNANLDVQVTGAGGIPASGVTAVVMNVTATRTTAAGFFTVYPTGATLPLASNLNWTAGVTVPNRVIVPVGTGGKVTFHNGAGNADLIVDAGGYFTDGSGSGASYVTLNPTRIVDTRYGIGGFTSRLGPGATMVVTIAGNCCVPPMSNTPTPKAVVLNVTVEGATLASDLVVWPDGASLPVASDLNFVRGQTVPNLVIVKLSAAGQIDIRNDFGSTSVIVDIVGWFG